jgi:hypothetical protein
MVSVSKLLLSRVPVVHDCNLSYAGGRDREGRLKSTMGKTFIRHPSQPRAMCGWSKFVIPAMWEAEIEGGHNSRPAWAKNKTLSQR